MEVVNDSFQKVVAVLIQKSGAETIHEDERAKKVLGRMLSCTESQRQRGQMHFRNFRCFSHEERLKIGDKVGFLS